jgi:hypothetical protein
MPQKAQINDPKKNYSPGCPNKAACSALNLRPNDKKCQNKYFG